MSFEIKIGAPAAAAASKIYWKSFVWLDQRFLRIFYKRIQSKIVHTLILSSNSFSRRSVPGSEARPRIHRHRNLRTIQQLLQRLEHLASYKLNRQHVVLLTKDLPAVTAPSHPISRRLCNSKPSGFTSRIPFAMFINQRRDELDNPTDSS